MKRILLILVFILSLGGMFADLTSNNELYYSLDDENLSGSNPIDLSINGNDGTNNGATTGVTGIVNESFDFDGTNDYIIQNSANVQDTTFSISIWFLNSFSGSSRTIAARSSDSSNRQYQLYQRGADNRIVMSFFKGGSTI